jgi:tRNA threonylcarbamoyladenosine biosynthesis protein TsaE
MMDSKSKLLIHTSSPEETEKIGEIIGREISPPFLLALFGELGSGKTTFLRGVARALGVPKIRSPSFIMVGEYEGRFRIYHIDLYRLDSAEELIPLGLLDIIFDKNSIVFIEWAERALNLLPGERIDIRISIVNELKRKIEFIYYEKRGKSLLLTLSDSFKGRGYPEKV